MPSVGVSTSLISLVIFLYQDKKVMKSDNLHYFLKYQPIIIFFFQMIAFFFAIDFAILQKSSTLARFYEQIIK